MNLRKAAGTRSVCVGLVCCMCVCMLIGCYLFAVVGCQLANERSLEEEGERGDQQTVTNAQEQRDCWPWQPFPFTAHTRSHAGARKVISSLMGQHAKRSKAFESIKRALCQRTRQTSELAICTSRSCANCWTRCNTRERADHDHHSLRPGYCCKRTHNHNHKRHTRERERSGFDQRCFAGICALCGGDAFAAWPN